MPTTPRTRRLTGAVVAGIQAASRALAIVGALVIFMMLLATIVDIVTRSTLDWPVPGVFEYSEIALASIVFLGLPYTMQVGGHVAIESLTARLPAAWQRWVEAGALIVTLPFVVWLAVAGVAVAAESFASGEVQFGVIRAPVWPARMVIPVGAALLAAEIAIAVGRLLRGQPASPGERRRSETV